MAVNKVNKNSFFPGAYIPIWAQGYAVNENGKEKKRETERDRERVCHIRSPLKKNKAV